MFFYGILILFVIEGPLISWLFRQATGGPARELIQQCADRLMPQKGLGWLCFWAGGLWSLQNLLF